MVTKRQKEVLNFIESYRKKEGYSPSLEDVKKHLKLTSVSTAHYHIKKLERLGLLRKGDNQPRSLTPTKEREMISVPIVGTIAAGEPIEAIEFLDGTVLMDKRSYNPNDNFYFKSIDDGIGFLYIGSFSITAIFRLLSNSIR